MQHHCRQYRNAAPAQIGRRHFLFPKQNQHCHRHKQQQKHQNMLADGGQGLSPERGHGSAALIHKRHGIQGAEYIVIDHLASVGHYAQHADGQVHPEMCLGGHEGKGRCQYSRKHAAEEYHIADLYCKLAEYHCVKKHFPEQQCKRPVAKTIEHGKFGLPLQTKDFSFPRFQWITSRYIKTKLNQITLSHSGKNATFIFPHR